MLASSLSLLAFGVASVHAHGYLTIPFSRTRLASEAGIDTCPECAILEPVPAWPDLNAADVGRSGPCGYNARVSKDYNQPGPAWGNSTVVDYKAGDIVDVQWCVDNNGDHGGMFSYRICQDQELVDKFLTPGYLPTIAEKRAAEKCFEAGLLKCTDVPGQKCGFNPDCPAGAPCHRTDWFTCGSFNDGSRCQSVDRAPKGSCYTSIAGGYTVSSKIKIPNYSSKRTLLSFKWNSQQTEQVYLSCADISISGGDTPPPKPSTSSTVPTSTVKSEAPSATTIAKPTTTAKPTEADPCAVSTDSRVDCGNPGITQSGCESKGCCWKALTPNPNNKPWCYKKA
ncbi:uncharacterized protein EV422DRAFT_551129 [Fimicolochytrium jonesii]|uniref:uncharacterized protein n=1 Tax=Fimicolochytrium jonesii TaxID=1396493 RepID=UPI0022FE8252|nr:uncharacterized protein EV422DRAFT_551129 [Fimicolochytrium jonesii]KAI8818974.1 hypothetical protein EV422DRAFT_551129 [Fimicolochytrium jonesii]